MTQPDAVHALTTMILDVLGDCLIDIEAATSFRDELAFQSIHFVALAELVQERWPDVDFVSWVTAKQPAELMSLRVGNVADFIVASS